MRLIDADAMLEGREDHEMISTHLIWNAPTIEAVELVRCKDCKYYSGIAYKTCIKIPYFWSEDGEGYCSLAERRTDADE